MPGPFTITPSSNLVTLTPEKRQGTVTFSAMNTLSRRVRATSRLVAPEGSPTGAWLTILLPGGENDAPEPPGTIRSYDLGETETYQIKIDVPNDVAPGSYPFHLVVADETNPDDQFTQSADVTIVVQPKPEPVKPPPSKFPIWIIPVILVLLVVVGVVIFLLTRGTNTPDPSEQLQLFPGTPHFGTMNVDTSTFPREGDPFILAEFFQNTLGDREAIGSDSSGDACAGWIGLQPVYAVQVIEPVNPLNFVYISTEGDASLIILDPNLNVHCTPDSQDGQPRLGFSRINEGMYYIWVGSKVESHAISGTLYVSQNCQRAFRFDC